MIKRKDLKVGDIIYVDNKGEQTGNKKDIKVTISKVLKVEGHQDKYVAIGDSKKGIWSSKYYYV